MHCLTALQSSQFGHYSEVFDTEVAEGFKSSSTLKVHIFFQKRKLCNWVFMTSCDLWFRAGVARGVLSALLVVVDSQLGSLASTWYVHIFGCKPSNAVVTNTCNGGGIFYSITMHFYCQKLHQCTVTVNLTGNVIIINYPNHLFLLYFFISVHIEKHTPKPIHLW